ncbi:MAG: TIGR03032 family protein [Pseudomonadota bacterium]
MSDTTTKEPALAISGSRLFTLWLAARKASLAFTTHRSGKLFLIGLKPDGALSVFERTFDQCMGMGVHKQQLWVSSHYQLWRFGNFLDAGQQANGYDALYVPVTGYTTGDVDIHDIHVGANGKPVFVVSRFNCLATVSDRGSFRPIWRPPFIDRIAAGDRCHLNGMAVREDGLPSYVTCFGKSNVADGWRQHRRDGGVVIDVDSGEMVATGLSMPHSPRLYNGSLWIVQTGTGEFGRIDTATGAFEAVCRLPGFARGITFLDDYAVIGLSRPFENRTFQGLPLNERLEQEGAEPVCGLAVVILSSGEIEHQLEIKGVVNEIYDVGSLPGVIRPMALGFKNDEIRFAVRPEKEATDTLSSENFA